MDDLEQALIENRRRQYADMAATPVPQGQMVGRIMKKPGTLDYIAAALRQYGGIKGQQQAEQDLINLQQNRRAGESADLQRFSDLLRGKPAVPQQQGNNASAFTPGSAAEPGDPAEAYGVLARSMSPALRQAGVQGIVNLPALELRKTERLEDKQFKLEQAAAAAEARAQQLRDQHQMRMDALALQNANREQMAQEQRAFQQQMAASQQAFQREMKTLGGAAQQPYFQPVQTAQGIMAFNARTGKVEPVMGPTGQPVVGIQADPTAQGAIAGAKASATAEGKGGAEARMNAPKVISQGEETIRLVDDLLKAPGFKQAVGGSRLMGVQNIPGTAAKDFDVRLDQLKGKQFLQAFETLRGGGQITEVEGKKATDAIARMNASGSEEEFTKAAREFQDVIRAGIERAKSAQSGGNAISRRLRFDAQGNPVP